jgi:hypothetical protein
MLVSGIGNIENVPERKLDLLCLLVFMQHKILCHTVFSLVFYNEC